MKTTSAFWILLALAARTAFAGGCGCEIGEPDPAEVPYDCCGGDDALSETITAPITCNDTACGTASGPLHATREECEDFESPVPVGLGRD